MPSSFAHSICRLRFLILAIGIATAIAAPAEAQQGKPGVATATMHARATVLPMLRITSTGLVGRAPGAAGTLVSERVQVAGNVAHRLIARPVADAAVEIRGADGRWTLVTRAGTVAGETRTTGVTAHLVQCRTQAGRSSAAGCGLVFELESIDPAFPMSTARSSSTT